MKRSSSTSGSGESPSSKRKRLSIAEKREVIQLLKGGSSTSQVAQHYGIGKKDPIEDLHPPYRRQAPVWTQAAEGTSHPTGREQRHWDGQATPHHDRQIQKPQMLQQDQSLLYTPYLPEPEESLGGLCPLQEDRPGALDTSHQENTNFILFTAVNSNILYILFSTLKKYSFGA